MEGTGRRFGFLTITYARSPGASYLSPILSREVLPELLSGFCRAGRHGRVHGPG